MKDNRFALVTLTHNLYVDSLLSVQKWAGSTISYAFPTSANVMSGTWPWSERPDVFLAAPTNFQDTARYWLAQVSSFTNLKFEAGSAATATLRWGLSSDPSVGSGANMPDNSNWAGDAFFGVNPNFDPTLGTGLGQAIAHELGHQLGLKHPHDSGLISPLDRDSNEFTVMSYTQNTLLQPGSGIGNGGTSSQDEYAQSYMISDIAALQSLYGANFRYNATDTVYSFDTSGRFFVNGKAQMATSGTKIYRAIWDGGGNDTYDFSNFSTNQVIDLRASGWSTISSDLLSGGFYGLDANGQRILDSSGQPKIFTARGNLANPDLYHGSTRSLIENANAGSGDDILFGNELANVLKGGAGNDALYGGKGADVLDGGDGNDTARYLDGFGPVTVDLGTNTAHGGAATGDTFVSIENVWGTSGNDRITGDSGANQLSGFGGADRLTGGGGNDFLDGGTGNDTLIGGAGDDSYAVDAAGDKVVEQAGQGRDTVYTALAVYALGKNVESLYFTDGSAHHGTGNTLDNAVSGGGGPDVLAGGKGHDTLTGGAGGDSFVFDTAANTALNLDTITDFQPGADKLVFSLAVFKGFAGPGALTVAAFWSGTGVTKAHDADDRLIYDTASGALWYDADGTGPGRAAEVAVLAGHPVLTYHDILIIA